MWVPIVKMDWLPKIMISERLLEFPHYGIKIITPSKIDVPIIANISMVNAVMQKSVIQETSHSMYFLIFIQNSFSHTLQILQKLPILNYWIPKFNPIWKLLGRAMWHIRGKPLWEKN